MSQLTGSFVGIVINDVDPYGLGRVQVYIPSLDAALPSILSGKSEFIFPGSDNNGSLDLKTIKSLRSKCSWAFVQQPCVGGSSMGRMDEETGQSTTSDTAMDTEAFKFNGLSGGAQNYGSKFAQYGARCDAFADPSQNFVRRGNFSGMDYFPENYINAPKGLFSLPKIGAKVLVTFLNGSRNHCIITGKLPNAREYQLINL